MRFIVSLCVAIAVAAVVAFVVFFLYGREKSWERLAGSPDSGQVDLLTVRRSLSSNDAMAGTEGLRADVDIVLPAYDENARVLLDRLATTIETVDPLARRVDDGSDPRHLRYVTYSPLMRFPDLVTAQVVALDDGKTGLLIYARAQLGRTDFGANLGRVKSYLPDR